MLIRCLLGIVFVTVGPRDIIPTPPSRYLIINPSVSIIYMFFLPSWAIICLYVCLYVLQWGSYLEASGTENSFSLFLSHINSYLIYMYCFFYVHFYCLVQFVLSTLNHVCVLSLYFSFLFLFCSHFSLLFL